MPSALGDQLELEPEPRLRRQHEAWLKSNAATDERPDFLPRRKRRRPTKRPVTAPGGWFFTWGKGLWKGHRLGVCVVFRPQHMDTWAHECAARSLMGLRIILTVRVYPFTHSLPVGIQTISPRNGILCFSHRNKIIISAICQFPRAEQALEGHSSQEIWDLMTAHPERIFILTSSP